MTYPQSVSVYLGLRARSTISRRVAIPRSSDQQGLHPQGTLIEVGIF